MKVAIFSVKWCRHSLHLVAKEGGKSAPPFSDGVHFLDAICFAYIGGPIDVELSPTANARCCCNARCCVYNRHCQNSIVVSLAEESPVLRGGFWRTDSSARLFFWSSEMSLNLISRIFVNQEIRIAVKDDDVNRPLFVAVDVAAALGYKDAKDAIGKFCKGTPQHALIKTSGGAQNLRVINEPDLYRMIFGSSLQSALRFQDWVFSEVLPSIRKTGEYVNADLKARIALLRSNNEDLESENRDMQATLCNVGVTYQQLYTVEHAILRRITNDPGKHSSAALEYLVHRDVKCTNAPTTGTP